MADKMKKAKFGSLQLDVEDVISWSELTNADFAPASSQEKENFIQDRESVSFWKDAGRRFRKNTVAMVALVILILVALFAFLGPVIVPYGYDQFIAGSENLHPWHYTLEDQEKLAAAQMTPEEAWAKAQEEAAAQGKTLGPVDKAKIMAAAKASGGADTDELRKELGIRARLFGYSNAELQRKAAGESVFPHVFGTDKFGRDIMVRVMIGTRVSMVVGLSAALLVLVIGALYGSISGYLGGKVDAVMQRIVEIIYSIPEVLVILLIATVIGDALTSYVNSHHPRPDPSAQAAGVRHRRPGPGRLRPPHHQKASAAQLHWTDRGHHLPPDPLRHLPGVLPLLPGRGRVHAYDQPGLHGLRGPGRHDHLSLPPALPRTDPEHYDPVLQPGGRRAPGRPGPEAEEIRKEETAYDTE